ncbi:MAG: YihA family ribosome biogenesis GTP-binding protein [Bacteroidia bacterium]|nr:MAG: YihA family ribosome biogenesis GTP-binding protein [Bacteroidia bacterium]
MGIHRAEFLCSSQKWEQCPAPDRGEVAFIGRSNVGKSSLINMLTRHGSLAKVSGTPGKTQLINHFLIDNSWYLVDLPGYGFAKISKKGRATLEQMIKGYVAHRPNLYCLFILLDVRLEPQRIDIEFMQWAAGQGVAIALVMTKADKLSKTALPEHVAAYREGLLEYWEECPPLFVSSAQKGVGREEIIDFIQSFIHQGTE